MINVKSFLIVRRRYNRNFKKFLKKYLHSEPSLLDLDSLRNFLISASKTKFWKTRFEKYNVNIHSKNLIYEIGKLPILTKEQVKNNYESILNINSN